MIIQKKIKLWEADNNFISTVHKSFLHETMRGR